jgi:hypothetical protein
MSNTVLAKMAVKIAADTAAFKGELAKTQSEIKSFQSNIIGLASSVGIAFGVKEVTQFAFEISKLAGEAVGVEAAFNKLPKSKKVLEDLKTATGGTVSELDLMKRTVQATNFGISLGALPKLLEFATIRAQQTGQSVDYLVDSIVTGIGRKSPLILDNLGISAIALKEKMNGVSLATASVGEVAEAVGKIAADNLKDMGSASDNTATKIAKVEASWNNLKVTVGKKLNESGVLDFLLVLTNEAFEGVSATEELNHALLNFNKSLKTGNFTGSYALQLKQLEERAKEAGQKIVILSDGVRKFAVIKPFEETVKTVIAVDESLNRTIITLESLKQKQDELNKQFEQTDANDKTKLINIGKEILAVKDQIEVLEELRKKQEQLQTQFAKDLEAGKSPKIDDPLANISRPEDGLFKGGFEIPDIKPQMNKYVDELQRGKTVTELWAETLQKQFDSGKINAQQLAEKMRASMADIELSLGLISLEEWGEKMRIMKEKTDESLNHQKESALAYGDAIGQALGDSIAGQEKAAQSLKRLTVTVIQEFLRQAKAAIIASAAKSGGPPPVALGLAAAGIAAISAMFGKLGGSGVGGGGGGGGSRGPSRSISNRVNDASNNLTKGIEIQVGGELVIDGNKMRYIINRTDQLNSRTRGS